MGDEAVKWNKRDAISKAMARLIMELMKNGYSPQLDSFTTDGGVLVWRMKGAKD